MTPQPAPSDAPAGQLDPLQRIIRACEWCNDRLTDRQILRKARFCCDAHRMAHWEREHPRLRPSQPSLFDPPPGPQFHLGPTHDVKVEQPRWASDCARLVEILKYDVDSHAPQGPPWRTYEQLAGLASIRQGSIRTRVSNIRADPVRWGVELEKRFQPGSRGCVEIRIKA